MITKQALSRLAKEYWKHEMRIAGGNAGTASLRKFRDGEGGYVSGRGEWAKVFDREGAPEKGSTLKGYLTEVKKIQRGQSDSHEFQDTKDHMGYGYVHHPDIDKPESLDATMDLTGAYSILGTRSNGTVKQVTPSAGRVKAGVVNKWFGGRKAAVEDALRKGYHPDSLSEPSSWMGNLGRPTHTVSAPRILDAPDYSPYIRLHTVSKELSRDDEIQSMLRRAAKVYPSGKAYIPMKASLKEGLTLNSTLDPHVVRGTATVGHGGSPVLIPSHRLAEYDKVATRNKIRAGLHVHPHGAVVSPAYRSLQGNLYERSFSGQMNQAMGYRKEVEVRGRGGPHLAASPSGAEGPGGVGERGDYAAFFRQTPNRKQLILAHGQNPGREYLGVHRVRVDMDTKPETPRYKGTASTYYDLTPRKLREANPYREAMERLAPEKLQGRERYQKAMAIKKQEAEK